MNKQELLELFTSFTDDEETKMKLEIMFQQEVLQPEDIAFLKTIVDEYTEKLNFEITQDTKESKILEEEINRLEESISEMETDTSVDDMIKDIFKSEKAEGKSDDQAKIDALKKTLLAKK